MSLEEQSTKDGLCHYVQDTVEDSLGVGRNNMPAFAKAPSNRIAEPEEGSPCTAEEEGSANIRAEGVGMGTSLDDEDVGSPRESHATEGVVSPLVGGMDKSTNKTGDDHEFVNKNCEKDGGLGKTSSGQEIHEQKWRRDNPVKKRCQQ